ncbi:arylsulfatase [Marivirga sp.]|uniref:sulfatase family protein n=1 Tax=Marivirga sp. TaxID=2018662 RepID=UPI0025FE1E5F|nr:arylsulfatase [Marivirga sp.]
MKAKETKFIKVILIITLFLLIMSIVPQKSFAQNSSIKKPPNIILIVADDLGYGDLSSYGATKIKTPTIDLLANQGVKFNNAYAASSMCSPSRYSILTGRYSWRTRLKYGVLKYFDTPLINQDRSTIGEMLQRNGYYTACVGKWHLGMDWTVNDKAPENPAKNVFDSWDANSFQYIDYSVSVKNGPIERGFDYFYGITGSNNMQPYVFIENEHVTQAPSEKERAYDHYNPADKAPNWDIRKVNIDLTNKAVEVINKHFKNNTDKPLFLYHPSTAPHRPCLPTFTKGESQAGLRGDVIQELDWSVGEIIRALKENNAYENTLIIFTSDNGPRAGDPVYWLNKYKDGDEDYQDAYSKLSENYKPELKKEDGNLIWKEGWITYDHKASGELLGFKSDAWEGGFRVPFLVSWPNRIKTSYENSNMLCLTDLYATIAEIIGETPSTNEGVDSYSFLSNIEDKNAKQIRTSMVLSGGASGAFVVLKDDFKYIEPAEKGRWPETYYPDGPSIYDYQLYNLNEDIGEQHNLYSENPEKVNNMRQIINKVKNNHKTETNL